MSRSTAVHNPPAAAAGATTVPRRALILVAILTLVWGTTWPLFPIAVREISVWTFRAIVLLGSGAFLLAVAQVRGQSLAIPREHRWTLVLASVCYLVIWNLGSTWAAIMIPSGQSAVLGFTMPLWVALFAWLALGQRPSGRILVAILLGAVSVIALMLPNFRTWADAPLGLAAGLAAGMGWAIGTLILKQRAIPVPAIVLTGWQTLVAGIPITLGALVFGDGQLFMPAWTTVAVVTYIALVPMAIGNLCWFMIVGILPANIAGLSSILVPVIAMLSGALVHGEPLGLLQWFAMITIVAALSLALLRPADRNP